MRQLAVHARGTAAPGEAPHVGIRQAGSTESNSENIRGAMARGLPVYGSPALCSHDGSFVVVGSGHSLPDFVEDIRAEQAAGRPVCAIKGAHDFLIDNGITPNLFVSVEPRERPLKHVSQDTIYLLASRCHPALFDQLREAKVMLFHCWSEEKECEVWMRENAFGVGGGTTSGMRAINIAYLMGFRRFVLYGFDSCLAPDKNTKRFSGETVGDALKVDVIVGGRRFWCNGQLADQANSFQEIYNVLTDITIDAKGDGLIAAIIAARRQRGMRA